MTSLELSQQAWDQVVFLPPQSTGAAIFSITLVFMVLSTVACLLRFRIDCINHKFGTADWIMLVAWVRESWAARHAPCETNERREKLPGAQS